MCIPSTFLLLGTYLGTLLWKPSLEKSTVHIYRLCDTVPYPPIQFRDQQASSAGAPDPQGQGTRGRKSAPYGSIDLWGDGKLSGPISVACRGSQRFPSTVLFPTVLFPAGHGIRCRSGSRWFCRRHCFPTLSTTTYLPTGGVQKFSTAWPPMMHAVKKGRQVCTYARNETPT